MIFFRKAILMLIFHIVLPCVPRFENDEKTQQSIVQLNQNIDKQIANHQNKHLEITMKQDSCKDVFSFNVPRYIAVRLQDQTEELAEVQDWNETIRLRRDMTLDEQRDFDRDYARWSENKINYRKYIFNDGEIKLIKYCIKTHLSDLYFRKIIDCYKKGDFDNLVEDPNIIKFINDFLSKKTFKFLLTLPSIKTAQTKQEFIYNIHLETLIQENNILFKPTTEQRGKGAIMNVILQFDNLDKFKFAQQVLLNNGIKFEQSKLTEQTIDNFTKLLNIIYKTKQKSYLESQLKIVQQIPQADEQKSSTDQLSEENNSTNQLGEQQQQEQKILPNETILRNEQKQDIEIEDNSYLESSPNLQLASSQSTIIEIEQQQSSTPFNKNNIKDQISPTEYYQKAVTCLGLVCRLLKQNTNAFITFEKHRFGMKSALTILEKLQDAIKSGEDETKKINSIKSSKVTLKGMDNFISHYKNKLNIQIN